MKVQLSTGIVSDTSSYAFGDRILKLSELTTHTSHWLGIPRATVESHARYLREAGIITSRGRGLAASDMSIDDKVVLLLSVCGVEVASRAAEYVSVWQRSLKSNSTPTEGCNFAFLEATSIRSLIVDLVTKDLNGGPLSQWLAESDRALGKSIGRETALNHTVTLDFYVDAFALELIVTRNQYVVEAGKIIGLKSHPISVKFSPPPPPLGILTPPRLSETFAAPSDLIRRLHEKNIVGWGACLRDE